MGYEKAISNFKSIDLEEMRPKGFLNEILQRQINNKETIDKNNGWEKRDSCPICKSTRKEYRFSKFDFDVFQCKKCDTAFFDVVPVNPNDIYSASHALGDAQTAYLTNKNYRLKRFASERIELFKKYINANTPLNETSVLDIGCGTGWFLEAVQKKGYNAYGLELGKDLAEFTQKRLQIPIWNVELKDMKSDIKFDVITMFDLIEHVKEPVELVNQAKEFLNDNGIILIFTPNFDSLAIKVMEDKSNLIMPSEHLSYFTERSIIELCGLTNMKLVHYETCGIDLGDLRSFYELSGNNNLKESCSNMYDMIQPFIDEAKAGNHLRAVISK